MLSPEQIAAKWRARAGLAADAIRQSVQAMTEADNPMAKAAAREEAWAAGVQRAAQERKFSRALRRVPFQQWQEAMIKKGIPNYMNGLASGEVKMAEHLRSFIPWINQGLQRLRSNPRGTLQQNIERSRIMQEHLANYRRGELGDFAFPINRGPVA